MGKITKKDGLARSPEEQIALLKKRLAQAEEKLLKTQAELKEERNKRFNAETATHTVIVNLPLLVKILKGSLATLKERGEDIPEADLERMKLLVENARDKFERLPQFRFLIRFFAKGSEKLPLKPKVQGRELENEMIPRVRSILTRANKLAATVNASRKAFQSDDGATSDTEQAAKNIATHPSAPRKESESKARTGRKVPVGKELDLSEDRLLETIELKSCPYCGSSNLFQGATLEYKIRSTMQELQKALDFTLSNSQRGYCWDCRRVVLTNSGDVPVIPGREMGVSVATLAGDLNAMGIPLCKVEEQLSSDESQLGKETLSRNVIDWSLDSGAALEKVLLQELGQQPVIVMDETVMPVLESKGQGVCNLRNSKESSDKEDVSAEQSSEYRNQDYIAVQTTPFDADKRITRIVYLGSRKKEAIAEALKDLHPQVLVTDAYQAYASLCEEGKAPQHQSCLVHLRRILLDALNIEKINDALFEKDKKIKEKELQKAVEKIRKHNQMGSPTFFLCMVIDALSKIYSWEHYITREDSESAEQYFERVRTMRQEHVQPLMKNIDTIMADLAKTLTKQAAKGRYAAIDNAGMYSHAVTYYMNQRDVFRTFLTNPRVPPDSNSAEQAVRPITVLRKSTNFKQTVKGTKALCTLLTLHETAKANGIRNIPRWLREFGCAYNTYREEKTLTLKIHELAKTQGMEKALKRLDTKLMAYAEDAGEGFNFTPWLPWNYKPKA